MWEFPKVNYIYTKYNHNDKKGTNNKVGNNLIVLNICSVNNGAVEPNELYTISTCGNKIRLKIKIMIIKKSLKT